MTIGGSEVSENGVVIRVTQRDAFALISECELDRLINDMWPGPPKGRRCDAEQDLRHRLCVVRPKWPQHHQRCARVLVPEPVHAKLLRQPVGLTPLDWL